MFAAFDLTRSLVSQIDVHLNRGIIYFTTKEWEKALEDFLFVSTNVPGDLLVLHTVALCQHKTRDLEASVETYSRLGAHSDVLSLFCFIMVFSRVSVTEVGGYREHEASHGRRWLWWTL
jgi:hypothetical protein